MKKFKLFILLFLIFITGCYNYNELNDLAIVTAIGIDKTESGYLVSIQLVNTQKTGTDTNTSGGDSKFTIYEAEGKTIEEAIKNVSYVCPKNIYLYHLGILIFGEDTAKKGIKSTMDYIIRNIETRGDVYVFVARGKDANDIIKVITPIETLNAKNIISLLEKSSKNLGKAVLMNFRDLLNNYINSKTEIVMPSITIVERNDLGEQVENIADSDPGTFLKIDETAIFKEDKLIGYMTNDETLGYNILKDSINETIVNYKCKNGYVEALINNLKTDVEVNEKLEVIVNIKASGNLSEVSCDINIESVEKQNEIEKKIAKQLEEAVKITFNRIKDDYNSDIFGILNMYYLNKNSFYHEIEKEWYDKHFNDLKIKVKAEVDLIGKGNTLKVIE